jgi:dephospho-CoA kinase
MTIAVGLTGSIASGKSFVTDYLRSQSYSVFDADNVARSSYNDEAVFSKIIEELSIDNITDGDQLRSFLSGFVFSDPVKLKKIELIIHPFVRDRMNRFINDSRDEDLVFLDIPLLFENRMVDLFDRVIVTYCSKDKIYQRLCQRGCSIEKVDKILDKQYDIETRLDLADFVIDTNFSVDNTYEQIDFMLAKLKLLNYA